MTLSAQPSDEPLPEYAQVAVPVHLKKLFTYRLPLSMRRAASLGSRVMVQLGMKPTAGYIVSLFPRLRTGTSLIESEIKDVQELLDVDPPLTAQALEITRWVADYYAAPWGEVLRAALPAGINATVEQTVSITQRGREQLRSATPAADRSVQLRALRLLADEGEFEVNAFCLRMGVSRIPKWLRELEQDGFIERSYRTRSIATRAKRRRAVRLVKSSDEVEHVTRAQQRAIEVLRSAENGIAVVDLIKAAKISESVVRTLTKKGVIAAFDENIRRDPLAAAELPDTEKFELTAAQGSGLR